jgi:hypothetical protein
MRSVSLIIGGYTNFSSSVNLVPKYDILIKLMIRFF